MLKVTVDTKVEITLLQRVCTRSLPEVSYKTIKLFLKNCDEFTGKHLRWRLFLKVSIFGHVIA